MHKQNATEMKINFIAFCLDGMPLRFALQHQLFILFFVYVIPSRSGVSNEHTFSWTERNEAKTSELQFQSLVGAPLPYYDCDRATNEYAYVIKIKNNNSKCSGDFAWTSIVVPLTPSLIMRLIRSKFGQMCCYVMM